MSKRFLLFMLLPLLSLAPFVSRAASLLISESTEWRSKGCEVDSYGNLECDRSENNVVNTLNVSQQDIQGSIELRDYDGAFYLWNTGQLELRALGAIKIAMGGGGGGVFNGFYLDGDDLVMSGQNQAYMKLEGSTVRIQDSYQYNGKSMSLVNVSKAYYPNDATQKYSVMIISREGAIVVNGNVWNNTLDGTAPEIVTTGARGISLRSDGSSARSGPGGLVGLSPGDHGNYANYSVFIQDDFIAFGGSNEIISNSSNVLDAVYIGKALKIDRSCGGSGCTGSIDVQSSGVLSIGFGLEDDGRWTGKYGVVLSSGANTFNIANTFLVYGGIFVDTGASLSVTDRDATGSPIIGNRTYYDDMVLYDGPLTLTGGLTVGVSGYTPGLVGGNMEIAMNGGNRVNYSIATVGGNIDIAPTSSQGVLKVNNNSTLTIRAETLSLGGGLVKATPNISVNKIVVESGGILRTANAGDFKVGTVLAPGSITNDGTISIKNETDNGTLYNEVLITGTVANSAAGKLYFGYDLDGVNETFRRVSSLTITGALSNSGVFHADVVGRTTIENIALAAAGSEFWLRTATVSGATGARLAELMSNGELSKLYLNLTDGGGANSSISTGMGEGVRQNRIDGTMNIRAQTLSINGMVDNSGTMKLYSHTAGDIRTGAVMNASTGTMEIMTTGNATGGGPIGDVTITGNVNNSGTLTISGGNVVTLQQRLTNTGHIDIGARGEFAIGGDIQNIGNSVDKYNTQCLPGSSCDMFISANKLTLNGEFLGTKGTALIRLVASGASTIGNLNISGGRLDLVVADNTDVLKTGAIATYNLSINNNKGFLNIEGVGGINTQGENINVGTNLTVNKAYGLGNLNVRPYSPSGVQIFTIDTTGSGKVGEITVLGKLDMTGAGNNRLTLTAKKINVNTLEQSGTNELVISGSLAIIDVQQLASIGGIISYTTSATPINGLRIDTSGTSAGRNEFELKGVTIAAGGAKVNGGKTLKLTATSRLTIGGLTDVGTDGTMKLTSLGALSGGIKLAGVSNNGTLEIKNESTIASAITEIDADINNESGTLTITSVNSITTAAINLDGGKMEVDVDNNGLGQHSAATTKSFGFNSLDQTGGSITYFGVNMGKVEGGNKTSNVNLQNNLAFGTVGGDLFGLNLAYDKAILSVNDLRMKGSMGNKNIVNYDGIGTIKLKHYLSAGLIDVKSDKLIIKGDRGTSDIDLSGGIKVASGAEAEIETSNITIAATGNITNNGTLTITLWDSISGQDLGDIINYASDGGSLTLISTKTGTSGNLKMHNITNNDGELYIKGSDSNVKNITLEIDKIVNTGFMSLGTTGATINIKGLKNDTSGKLVLYGSKLFSTEDIYIGSISGVSLLPGFVHIDSTSYLISMTKGKAINVKDSIVVKPGSTLKLETNILDIGSGIIVGPSGSLIVMAEEYNKASCPVNGLCATAVPPMPGSTFGDVWTPWLKVRVGGNVDGNVKFASVGYMEIAGDYTFNMQSSLHLNVYDTSTGGFDFDFMGTVRERSAGEGGGITISMNGGDDPKNAIVKVTGKFIHQVNYLPEDAAYLDGLKGGNIGLSIFDLTNINSQTAIWLLHANEIVKDGLFDTRHLSVYFCNANGKMCVEMGPQLGGNLPAFLYATDKNLYAVFDAKYGGLVILKWVEPQVSPLTTDENTIVAAGALDNWLYYNLGDALFNPDKPLPVEAIPLTFEKTIFKDVAIELQNRFIYAYPEGKAVGAMGEPEPLHQFTRLFIPTEAAQYAWAMNTSDRMYQLSMQKRVANEMLWPRKRKRSKIWVDGDYGMQTIKIDDEAPAAGSRMSFRMGYDRLLSPGAVFGLSGGYTMVSSTQSEDIMLGFDGKRVPGKREVVANDATISVGGYLLARMIPKAWAYISGNYHMHTLTLTREQNFMGDISGTGAATSVTGEVGITHSLYGQEAIGNVFVRAGMNQGMTLEEKVGEAMYMDMKQKAYTTVAPGYILTFQKRMYLNPTFIMRPYMSVGGEYEAIGMGDTVQYRLGGSDEYSDYKLTTDPMWITGKVGAEFLMSNGTQFGIGYEYHHNAMIQTHNVRFGGNISF